MSASKLHVLECLVLPKACCSFFLNLLFHFSFTTKSRLYFYHFTPSVFHSPPLPLRLVPQSPRWVSECFQMLPVSSHYPVSFCHVTPTQTMSTQPFLVVFYRLWQPRDWGPRCWVVPPSPLYYSTERYRSSSSAFSPPFPAPLSPLPTPSPHTYSLQLFILLTNYYVIYLLPHNLQALHIWGVEVRTTLSSSS